jgi:formylglycine-generating enzyme
MSTRNADAVRRVVAALLVAVSVSRPVTAQVTFDWATIGNPGNAADTAVMSKPQGATYVDLTTGYGSVGYTYQISKYDVTNAQYVAFLNAADPSGSNTRNLYDTNMSDHVVSGLGSQRATTGGIDRNLAAASGSRYSVKSGQEQYPAVWVRWSSAARFVNWLSNGQGAGSTETGVYDVSVFAGSGFATPPTRAPGATTFLPSENEYYKAAYYDPTKSGTGGYWQYGTRTDSTPVSEPAPGGAYSANIGSGLDPNAGGTAFTLAKTQAAYDKNVDYLTPVGAYTSATSAYGLFDVDGLVRNWTEGTRTVFGNQLPVARGGMWRYGEQYNGASYRNSYSGAGTAGYSFIGFRVAGLPSAPPSSLTINVGSGTQTQTQAGYPSLSGTTPVFKAGAGTLVLDAANTLTGATTVQGGRLQLANGAALASSRIVPLAGGTLSLTPGLQTTVGGLAPGAGGLTDVGNGMVTVATGLSAASMVAAIVTGMGDGGWNGTSGIASSVAASSGGDRTVGWIDNGDGSVAFAFAAAGDTNLDWQVDIIDAANFLAGGKFDTGSPASWNEGDFTYDGVVDILDAASFLSNGLFDAGAYNAPPGSAAAVPEPTGWALVGFAVACASGCRRRGPGSNGHQDPRRQRRQRDGRRVAIKFGPSPIRRCLA